MGELGPAAVCWTSLTSLRFLQSGWMRMAGWGGDTGTLAGG